MSDYFKHEHLKHFGSFADGNPQAFERFLAYYGDITGKPGALSVREKALIALAVAHVFPCPYCIESFTNKCLENGVDLEQMSEAVHVAAALQAGATLVHGMQMKETHDRQSM